MKGDDGKRIPGKDSVSQVMGVYPYSHNHETVQHGWFRECYGERWVRKLESKIGVSL